MKSVYFTEEHALFRQTVRTFMETEVAPFADAWEAERRIPREIWHRMGEMGFLGLLAPEQYGGVGGDIFHAMIFCEELARSRMGGFAAAVEVQQFIATGALASRGSETLKARYYAPSVSGRAVGAICISEPDTGSDVAAIRTTATRDGDHFVINGAKTWITNGVYGDFYVVAAKTARDAGPGGLSLILVDGDAPGISANKLNKMGWHCSDTAEIFFDNVRVPVENLLGTENMGFYYIMETFAIERLVGAAGAIGSCDVAFEETLAYMKSRETFGRPLTKYQALRHRLADLFAEVASVRQLVYHTAWLYQAGENPVKESSMAKLLATELAKKVMDECLQFFGGFGYTEAYPLARFYRDARVGTIVAGTSEIMREIIAKMEIDGTTFRKTEEREAAAPAARATASAELAASSAATATATAAPALPATLGELFAGLPARHRPERTENWTACFHFRFEDSATPEWTVTIGPEGVSAREGLEGAPSCEVVTSEALYLGIVSGSEDPQMAFLSGRVRVSNLNEMLRFLKAFRRGGS